MHPVCLLVFCLAATLGGATPCRAAASLNNSEQLLLQGRVDDTVSSLRAVLQSEPRNAAAHLLLCRTYLSEEAADQAVTECEAAVSVSANDSVAQDWMGRAYGLKAGRVGPFSGFSLARKVRDSFEAAVRLNPKSGDAFDDLGEYYLEAPSIVGGGIDKANALAAQGSSVVPRRARILRALIAEKQKDYTSAERDLRAAAEDGNQPDAWVDLGSYYGRRKQDKEALAAIRHAVELDKARDSSLAHAAETVIKFKLEPALAITALRSYLSGPSLSDSAPACKAHTNLGRLLAASGEKAAAKMEFQTALALASGYAPARKELAAL